MEIEIKNTLINKTVRYEINKSDNIIQLKKRINSSLPISMPLNQIGIQIKNGNDITPLSNNSTIISKIPSLTDQSIFVVIDQGPQIETDTANVIEYACPIIVFIVYFIYFYPRNLNSNQYITIAMSIFHYAKRVFESIFVHIHTKTMALSMLGIECIYYTGFYAFFCGWNIFTNKYAEVGQREILLLLLFIFSELNNGHCHLILRKIRLNNINNFQIPKGNVFEYVYCANYFWEVLSWLSFSMFCKLWSCYLFTLFGFIVMASWAYEKRASYIKYLKNSNKSTKAIIPFIF